MPLQKKAQWARLKVGILSVAALIILGVLIFLLTGSQSFFAHKAHLYTYLGDSAALPDASPVRLNGITIGKVDHINLTGLTTPNRIVRVEMSIDEKFLKQIPIDSNAGIGAESVLGSKYINITKGTKQETVRDGYEIQSRDIPDFNDFMEQGNNLLVQLQGILKRVDAIVSQVELGRGSIGKLLVDEELYNRLLAITREVNQLASALNTNKGTLGKLVNDDALYNDFRGSLARVDSLIAGLQQGEGSAGKFLKDPELYDQARGAIVDLRKIITDLDAGKGTAGKLLKSEDLHNELMATMKRIDGILDKVSSGQGTLGQMLVNQQLYDNLNGTMRETHELIKDMRSNPKKFLSLRIHIF